MSSVVLGAKLALFRLRSIQTALAAGFALSFVVVASLLERYADSVGAADRALSGASFGITLPLLAFFCLDHVCGGAGLERALQVFARHGPSRRRVATGFFVVTTLALAAGGAFLGALVVCLTRWLSDPALLWDLAASGGIGALGGMAYAGLFMLGSAIGRTGGGRLWALAIDWLLGSGASAWSMPFPRGHVRNLLGVDPLLAVPFWSALLALLLLALVYALLAVWRCPP